MMKALAKETVVYSLADFVTRFVNFMLFPFIAIALTVADFGVYVLLSTLWILISRLSGVGLSQSLQHFYLNPDLPQNRKNQIITAAFAGMALSTLIVIMLLFSATFAFKESLWVHNQIDMTMVLIVLLGSLPMQIFNFDQNLHRLDFSPWKFTLLSVVNTALIIIFTLLFLFYFHWGIIGVILAPACAFVSLTPWSIFSLRKRLSAEIDWSLLREMITFGLPFFGTEMAQWVYFSMDRWILGELADNTAVGLYSMAFRLAMAMILIIMAFTRSWGPRALKAYEEDPHYCSFFVTCYQGWFYFLICCATALSLFGPEILQLLTPEPYWEASKLLPALCMGLAFYGTTHAAIVFVSISKQTKSILPAVWISVALNLFLNFWWISLWGSLGAAYAILATFLFLAFYYLRISRQVFPLPYNLNKLMVCTGLAAAGLAIAQYLTFEPWQPWHLLVKGAWMLVILAYAIMGRLFTGDNTSNKKNTGELAFSDISH